MPQSNARPPVLVTGGAGYIGSHACKALHRAGFLPIVYDNLSRGHADSVLWGPLEVGDLADGPRLADVARRWQPVAAMHFAAFAYVGESVANPGLYYDNNIGGSLSLFRTLVEAGITAIVFSSTCAVYGDAEIMPIRETTPTIPLSPYGYSKLVVERMLADFETAHGLRNVCLRYFNAAGASPDGDIGERHDPETHLVPRCLMAVTGHVPALEIYGTDYPTHDGTAMRDYIHVDDLAAAHVMALRRLLAGGPSLTCNLGTGSGLTVKEIVSAVERIAGRPVPYFLRSRRAGDAAVVIADPAMARRELDWMARVSDVDSLVRTAWSWHVRSAAPVFAA